MDQLFTLSALVSLLSLTLMEIVLGIDNVIFISIVSGKLPREEGKKARFVGLFLALLIRIALLFTLTWLKGQEGAIFTISGHGLSIKDLILFSGGVFLIYKTIEEILEKLSGKHHEIAVKRLSFNAAVVQIVLLDIVFSFDSILTAIGISNQLPIMIGAVILSLIIMLIFSGAISDFVNRHTGIKMLALSFLLMIGFLLIVEGLPDDLHIEFPKEYLYFAMAFSLSVELLNIQVRKRAHKRKIATHPESAAKEHGA